MRWPWRGKVEKRAGLTDAIVSALVGQAGGGVLREARNTAAVEAAAGYLGRTLSMARVDGAQPAVANVLTPDLLNQIGRALIRSGEALYVIDLAPDGGLALRPASGWDVRGGPAEDTWTYRVDLAGPSATTMQFVAADGVVHFRYASDPAAPWRGLSPLASAALSGALHAGVIAALAADTKALPAAVIPLPPVADGGDQLDALKSGVTTARGRSVFVETTRSSFGGDHRDAPATDWKQQRLGPNPPETLAGLQESSAVQILAACGLDPLIVGLVRGDGSALRESYRRAERTLIQPVGRLVASELRRKLNAPDLALDFAALRASDFAGLSRSLRQLSESGLTLGQIGELLDLDLEQGGTT